LPDAFGIQPCPSKKVDSLSVHVRRWFDRHVNEKYRNRLGRESHRKVPFEGFSRRS
jgi:hypothetical protein